MKLRFAAVAAAVLALAAPLAFPVLASSALAAEAPDVAPAPAEAESVTRHRAVIGGRDIAYEVKAGRLALTDADNRTTAHMFYVAYTVPTPRGAPERPVTFVYNGGPGSASLWLHMGGIAPVRVRTDTPAPTRPAPYDLEANPHSILDRTDLVFLDAVGTGYSRLTDAEHGPQYYGIDADADAFAQAVRRYMGQNDRWGAPKFLMGESYGGPRSAVLSHRLQSSGVQLNGVILISPILNFGQHASGLDREPVNLLPTYAATAYFHNRTARHPGGLQGHVEEARRFALGDYAAALAQGHRLPDDRAAAVARELQRLTGLSADYWRAANLRVLAPRFAAELLRDQRRLVGRLDGRVAGAAPDGVRETAGVDPSGELNGAYTASYLTYLSRTLGYRSEAEYRVNNGALMSGWRWSHQPPGAPFQYSGADTTVDLAAAMRANPHLKVIALSGYYDLVTPFFATEWDLAHMPLDRDLAANITERFYEGGHMFYSNVEGLRAMKADLDAFYDAALAR